ncbi:MAG: DUF3667 domain-containing protein [Saprospiraceae bacterium]
MSQQQLFCPHCGQKYTKVRVSLLMLIGDFFRDVLNVEGRLWRSLVAIFVPGRLTNAFFEGKRQRYVSPVRLFFFTALLFFAMVGFVGKKAEQSFKEQVVQASQRNIYYALFLDSLSHQSDSLKEAFSSNPAAVEVLDSLAMRMRRDYTDSVDVGVNISFNESDTKMTSVMLSRKDMAQWPADTLVQRYAPEASYWEKLLMRQNIKLQKEGDSFFGYLISQMVWMMLLMMPMVALLLKLLYIRRDYYYVDHLIFSFHTHAFTFVASALTLWLLHFLLKYDQDGGAGIIIVSSIVIPVFLVIAIKRVYKQSFWKTLLKFLLLLLGYFTVFFIFLILTILVSTLMY